MLQYLSQEQQARKKVFFKPEISSEMKFNPILSPQFVNDTNFLYMSAYDFMSYNTDEESFSLLHRPLPTQEDLKRVRQEFVNVNFGRSSRERANQIFYLIKNTSENEQKYFLGRRMNSVNHDYERRLIAENKKTRSKSFHVEDLDNYGNIKQTNQKPKKNQDEVPNGILEFKKQFIIKPSLSLIVFVVKKKEKQPEIKLSVKNISEVGEESEEQFENPSPPPTTQFMKEENSQEILQKRYKNHLLIHSYSQNQTMTFQLEESIESAFQVLEGSPNLICTTEKFVYLLNFEVKNVYVPSHKQSGFSMEDKTSYHDSSRGYLNSDIKVEILDKFQLDFYIKNEGLLNKNLFLSNNCEKNKKRQRKNKSLAFNSIINDRRISSILKPTQRISQQSCSNLSDQNLENNRTQNSKLMRQKSNKKGSQDCESVKVIKKALQILPLSFHQQEFVLIVYAISRVLSTFDSIETLSLQYESEILSVQPNQLFAIHFQQYFAKVRSDVFNNFGNGPEETLQLPEQKNGETNILNCINELGGITVNKGVILIWEKFQPVIHQIVYKVDYHTNEMLDLSDPKNLRSQKTIFESINHILEYRNKITLFLDSNLIREVIISPTSQNFLILTGRNHLNNQYHDSERDNIDHRPQDIDEKYDIDDYLIFQYDLYAELWSSDASVYLKNIPLCYQKRKVEEIAPFTLKEQVLALTGKTVHEMHKSLLDGVLDFDLHPYGYFVAVSFGFNAKIYSLEHNTLNLMYTFNAQGIKKIKYSPNGSDIVIMSQKSIKILDSYSFAIKYILPQKNSQSSFTNFAFTSLGYKFCSVYDNININIYDGKSYKKLQSIKPGQSSLLGIYEKIQTIVLDTEEKFIFGLLESGKIYFKWDEDVVVIKHQKIYEYEDGKLINCVHFDSRQGVLFCGLQDGIVRAHIWPIINPSYSFDTYSQFKFGYSLITAIKSSKLANTVYIGDISGNLTTSKFIVQKEKKITGELRPNNYYIFSSYSPMINMPRSQLQSLEKCYKFVLGTNNETEDGEKMKLEYKFTEIITKMNEQMKRFKKQMREKLTQRQEMATGKINFSKLYNSQKIKLTEINRELRYLGEKYAEETLNLTNKYDAQMKKIVNEQNELIKEKGLQLSKNMMARMLLKQMFSNEYNALKQQQQRIQNEYTAKGLKGIELMTRQQELVPYDEIDYVPEGFAEVKVELIKKLQEELVKEQQHNYQLKQECAYMENAITNLQLRSIKEETLQFRVNIELQEMQSKLQQQSIMNQNIKQELKDAEHKINKTQARMIKKSPQFQKSLEGTSNDDACAYKLFLKDKMIQQIELLYDHFNNLNEIMDQKQQDIVNVVTFKKKVSDSLQSLNKKKSNMKYYIRELKDHLISVKNQISQLNFQCLKYEDIQETKKEKKNRAEQIEKHQQSFHQQSFSMKKILATLIKNQITPKKPKIDKIANPRSKSKNQTIIIENQIQAHNILVKKFTRQKQGNALNSDSIRSLKKKTLKVEETPIQTQEMVGKIVQMIDEKVKNQLKAISNQKSSMQTTFRSSTKQKTFTKKLKKFNSEKFFTQNPNSISYRLIEKLRQKEEQEKQLLKNQEPNKIQLIKDSVIPFSATSSPQIKKISSNFNVYEKSTNYLKNNVKIQQRKVKRLNGETAELISEYEKLRYENKEFSDKQTFINEGIEYLNQMQMKQESIKSSKNGSDTTVKMVWKTPFLQYIDQKSSHVSSNKTLSNFKDNMTSRMMTLFTSRSSKNPFNFASTAYNSPRVTTPIKISQNNSFFKKK